jgi:hypothetical protein
MSTVYYLSASIAQYTEPAQQLSGSMEGTTITEGLYELSPGQVYSSGVWYGAANSLGAEVYHSGTMQYEEWLGTAATLGVVTASSYWSENHDTDNVTSDDVPSPAQGVNYVSYNPFPYPDEEPSEDLNQRDTTRYHKAYSFTRSRPIRFRVIRRG